MGSIINHCVKTPPSSKDESAANAEISKDIQKQQKMENLKYKLLLLGPGGSGKSTLLKQMRRIHGRNFEESECLTSTPHLMRNVIEAMRTLAIYSDILADQGRNTRVLPENNDIRNQVARLSDNQIFTEHHYNDFKKLYQDPGIIRTISYRNEYQLIDTAEYLFNRMECFFKKEYIPTFEDIIHSRQRTTGVHKLKFQFLDKKGLAQEMYEIFDVGGQKNERRKWFHFFDNTAAIIFVVALSGYCQVLWEDNRTNRMSEAIYLFRGIVNLEVFNKSHFIFFLNKSDLFDMKYKVHSIKKYFDNYEGDVEDKVEIISFFKDQFKKQAIKSKIDVHFHVTCATDTKTVKIMFESARTIMIKQELKNQGFV